MRTSLRGARNGDEAPTVSDDGLRKRRLGRGSVDAHPAMAADEMLAVGVARVLETRTNRGRLDPMVLLPSVDPLS